MKQLRVYLSSTFEDLREYRLAVLAKLEQAGLAVAAMESYTAADERPLDKCLADVASADIYVGVFAWRYGYEPPPSHGNPEGRSITELEYRQAEAAKLQKLIFFAHPGTRADWPEQFIDELTGQGDRGAKLARFRSEVGTEKLASFFDSPAQLASLVLAAIMRSGKSGRVFNIPPRPAGFVQRPNETDAIVQALVGSSDGGPGHSAVIGGAGGFGKTTLAIDVCHQPGVIAAFPDGLLWTVLGEKPDMPRVLADLHGVVTGDPPAVTGIDELGKVLGKALAGRRCLLVIDDAWRADDLSPFLGLLSQNQTLLITTRIQNLVIQAGQSAWPEVPVDEMGPAEAASLLGRGLVLDDSGRNTIAQLADQLGHWPLLLDLVNARLQEEQRSRPGPAVQGIARVRKLFELKGVLGFDRRDAKSRNTAVARSVDVGLERAEELEPGLAAKAVEMSIFAEDLAIPVQALADLWSMDADWVEEDVLRHLNNLSLIHWNRESATVSLHDMIRRAYGAKLADAPAVHRRLLDHWGDPFHLPHAFAWQWFAWHCREGHAQGKLLPLLMDPAWLQARLDASTRQVDGEPLADVAALVHDCDMAPPDSAAAWVRSALWLSSEVVSKHPQALVQQLYGRLGACDDESLKGLLEACTVVLKSGPILPLRFALTPPSKAVTSPLKDKNGVIRAKAIAAQDRSVLAGLIADPEGAAVRLWNLSALDGRGEPKVLAEPEYEHKRDWSLSADGRHALCRNPTLLWNVATGLPRLLKVDDARFVSGGKKLLTWDPWSRWALEDLEGSGELQGLWNKDLPGCRGTLPVADDRHVVAWYNDDTLRLWNLAEGGGYTVLPGNAGKIDGVTLSSDGQRALVWSDDLCLRLWDLARCDEPRVLSGHRHTIVGAAILPGARHIVSWSEHGETLTWDLAQDGLARVLVPADEPRPGRVLPLAEDTQQGLEPLFLPFDGNPFGGLLEKLSAAPAAAPATQPQAELNWPPPPMGPIAPMPPIALNPPGLPESDPLADLFGSASAGQVAGPFVASIPDPFAELLAPPDLPPAAYPDPFEGLLVPDAPGQAGVNRSNRIAGVTGALAWPDGRRLLTWSSAGHDSCLMRLWDLEDETEPVAFRGTAGAVLGVVLMPDGSSLLAWHDDHALRVWDSQTARELSVLVGHEGRVQGCVVSPDGRGVLSWSADASLRIWDLDSGQATHVLRGHEAGVRGAIWTPDGAAVLSWGDDKTIRCWNLASADASPVIVREAEVERVQQLSDDRRVLVWTNKDLQLWDLLSDTAPLRVIVRGSLFDVVHVLADGQTVFVFWQAVSVRLTLQTLFETRWLVRGNDLLGRPADHVLLRPDERHALCWSENHPELDLIELWPGGAAHELAGHEGSIDGVTLSPDGSLAVSWARDSTVRLWSLDRAAVLRVLQVPPMRNGQAADARLALLSANGERVLVSTHSSLLLWDFAQSAEPRVLVQGEERLYGALLLPDGRRALYWTSRKLMSCDLDCANPPVLIVEFQWFIRQVLLMPEGNRVLCCCGDEGSWPVSLDQTGAAVIQPDHAATDHGVESAVVLADQLALSWSQSDGLLLWDLEDCGKPKVRAAIDDQSKVSLCEGIRQDDIERWLLRFVEKRLTHFQHGEHIWGAKEGQTLTLDGWHDRILVNAMMSPHAEMFPDGHVLVDLGRGDGRSISDQSFYGRPHDFRSWQTRYGPLSREDVAPGQEPVRPSRHSRWARRAMSKPFGSPESVELDAEGVVVHAEGVLLLPDERRAVSWWRNWLQLWAMPTQDEGLRELGSYFADDWITAVDVGCGGTRVLLGDRRGFIQVLQIADDRALSEGDVGR